MEQRGILRERLTTAQKAEGQHPKVPQAGIWVPAVTFFEADTDRLNLRDQAKHFSYLADSGIRGLVVLGSNAEAFLLTREERRALLSTARKSVPADFPIMAGVGGHSTAQVLEYIQDAHAEGANYALVLPCAYFGKQTTPSVVKEFFQAVATSSPLPIVVYNFPAVCNGLDLDSSIVASIAQTCSNVVGVKFTCGSTAKINRLAATLPMTKFAVFGGQLDYLVAALESGSAGCVTAFGNVFPRVAVEIYNLWLAGKKESALELQWAAALAEAPTKAGIAMTKSATALFAAPRMKIEQAVICLRPRHPYPAVSVEKQEMIKRAMEPMNRREKALMGEVSSKL